MAEIKPTLTSKKRPRATGGQVIDLRDQTEDALRKGAFFNDELFAIHRSGLYIPRYQQFVRDLATELLVPVFDLAGSIKILGQNSVITLEQNVAMFNRPPAKGQIVVGPSMEQIQQCAAQNKAGKHNWFLSYASDLSLVDQHAILGTTEHPRFYPGVDWFLQLEQKDWATAKPQAGYYLLDMTTRWNQTKWEQQGLNIEALGPDFERADERVFSQAALAYQKRTGQRLFSDRWHWGNPLDSYRFRVCVELNPGGLNVDHVHPSYGGYDDLYVCVARKSACRYLIA